VTAFPDAGARTTTSSVNRGIWQFDGVCVGLEVEEKVGVGVTEQVTPQGAVGVVVKVGVVGGRVSVGVAESAGVGVRVGVTVQATPQGAVRVVVTVGVDGMVNTGVAVAGAGFKGEFWLF